MKVAIVHDALNQRGGAERVVLSMAKAFPGAPVYTSVYNPDAVFPEFGDMDVRTTPLNSVAAFRTDSRRAMPLLAPAFSAMRVDADVVLCSSSGWAHGCRTVGKKVVYCHNPARWLYQTEDYLGGHSSLAVRLGLATLRRPLLRWDRAAAATATRYLTQSHAVQARIAAAYGRHADLLPAPLNLDQDGAQIPLPGTRPGFLLCVSRLQPYKHVAAVIEAFRGLNEHLVVVGDGPERSRLEAMGGANVTLAGTVSDAQIRWLYTHCVGVVGAAHEDYGLTPIEALGFGKPAAVLRYGGYLDTVVEGDTGVFFDRPEPGAIADAVITLKQTTWRPELLAAKASEFREETFIRRLREIANDLSNL